ncbi:MULTISPECIES: L-lactate permease [Streptomyces]|uniref:L-lactate permease n=1 Tax=Streptomyces TaxID=1883 RepID=UPI001D13CA64|nr:MULTISPECIES: L-lactate permease [Streptomyces]MCC3652238.1 L-lactate permease [Streptomyces sp. S07_1.15]WSQ73074.1 L-lactate permease [Streptomyces xinghaiensis]
MYQPDISPIADSLGLSALVAALPLLTLFVLLGGLRMKAHWAGLVSLAVAVLVAVAGYGMAPGLALLSATQGAAFGLFPIMWIVLTAIWVYQLTVVSGRFEDLRRAFGLISDDPRIQAVIIAFCFGGLLEALAGFGAPVAITGVMLMALGFSPVRAAITVLVANTAPVAFGAIAIPIITAGELTKIPYTEIGAYVGRQTPLLAVFVPLLLVALVDGKRGVRQTWPAALVCGAAFGLAQFVSANYISVELTDIIASLIGLAALVVFLRVWKPQGGQDAKASLKAATEKELGTEAAEAQEAANATSDRREGSLLMAFLPYLIIIAIFSLAKLWTPLKEFLASTDVKIPWPGLDGNILNAAGDVVTSTVYTLPWLSSPGTLLLISGVLVALVYKVDPATTVREFGGTVAKLRWALLTVATVLALAYVLNMSGQTITMGTWIAGTGAAFAFLSPILGWLGVAVTGSDTSANALFATLQQAAAAKAGLDPTLLVAANTSGGVVGKMISPQNLTIAATAVGLVGKESQLFRGAIKWSLGLLLAMCVLVYLQSNVLAWMLP